MGFGENLGQKSAVIELLALEEASEQGSIRFFYKAPEKKYFSLCRP